VRYTWSTAKLFINIVSPENRHPPRGIYGQLLYHLTITRLPGLPRFAEINQNTSRPIDRCWRERALIARLPAITRTTGRIRRAEKCHERLSPLGLSGI